MNSNSDVILEMTPMFGGSKYIYKITVDGEVLASGPINLKTPWISVEDRLPEKPGRVLVVRKFPVRSYGDAWICTSTWTGKWFEDGYITHWMPLPDPPEVSQ